MLDLEQKIRQAVTFSRVTPNGFHKLDCKLCGDTQKRGAFVFGVDEIGYNCFRGKCVGGTRFVYGEGMSKTFKSVMDAYGIDIPYEMMIRTSVKVAAPELDADLYQEHEYHRVEVPADFVKYDPAKHREYKAYLDSRCIDGETFMIGGSGMWRDQLIMPMQWRGRCIGWEAINIHTGRYLMHGNSDMIYVPNGKLPQEPYIVEGRFDAMSLPFGCSIHQSEVTKRQAYMLRNSSPILIPDRTDSKLFESAKKYGWRVSIPAWTEKDANAALQRYGIYVIAKMAHDGICKSMYEAEIRYKTWRLSERNYRK